MIEEQTTEKKKSFVLFAGSMMSSLTFHVTTKSNMSVLKEFHLSVLGSAEVGKTGLISRLLGGTFNRKTAYKATSQEEPVKSSIEVESSVGLILFHFYDWSWAEKRKEVDSNKFNSFLSRGCDGAVFVYSVISKESKKDFDFFNDWYERASGYDKPWCIVSNKNDQKKRQVSDEEGKALANKGNRRSYIPISLVDDSGVDDIIVGLTRLFMNDLNLTVRIFKPASEESLSWSTSKRAALVLSAHVEAAASNVDRTDRVLCLVPPGSGGVFEKMEQATATSSHYLQSLPSIDAIEEQLRDMTLKAATSSSSVPSSATATTSEGAEPRAPGSNNTLPVSFVVGTPSLSPINQNNLKALAAEYGVHCLITVPRSILEGLDGMKKI